MNKTVRYVIYGIIVALCVLAIIVGVYGQVHVDYENTIITQNTIIDEKSSEDKDVIDDESFKKEFYNSLNQKYDMSNINVRDESHADELVFSVNIPKENTIGNIILPAINIKSDVVDKLNAQTEKYIEIKNKVSAEAKTLNEASNYEVGYAAYIYDDILSIAIRCSYKIGYNYQVVNMSSYNYDIKNDKLVTMNDIVNKYNINTDSVEGQIKAIIERKNNSSKDVYDNGNSKTLIRDVNSDMYKLSKSDNFLLTEKGDLYIIYSYATQQETATYDVVKIDLNSGTNKEK